MGTDPGERRPAARPSVRPSQRVAPLGLLVCLSVCLRPSGARWRPLPVTASTNGVNIFRNLALLIRSWWSLEPIHFVQMTSKDLYRRFAALCQKWPKDESKVGRDYGEVFRAQLTEQFPHGELGEVKDPKRVAAAIGALERIANNNFFNENPLKRSSASGLEAWACHEAISNEGLKSVQEQDEMSLINRLMSTMSAKFLGSRSDFKVTPTERSKANKSDKVDSE